MNSNMLMYNISSHSEMFFGSFAEYNFSDSDIKKPFIERILEKHINLSNCAWVVSPNTWYLLLRLLDEHGQKYIQCNSPAPYSMRGAPIYVTENENMGAHYIHYGVLRADPIRILREYALHCQTKGNQS